MSNQRDRIHSLLALAQHPNTPQHEAETALAMASKLMQKHGFSHDEFAEARVIDDAEIVIERVHVGGRYRVRRTSVLYAIASLHSCSCYREIDEDDECVLVLYGRAVDIFAARTLFAAADAMGARLLPRGDRSYRVSWWQGFQSGITEALTNSRKEFIAETPGAGLVLADRMQRADHEKRVKGPPLRKTYSYLGGSADAYGSGQQAGRGFSSGGRSFTSGTRGELN
jgi:hypothetical protein